MKTLQKISIILLVAICIFAIIPQNICLASDADSAMDVIGGLDTSAGVDSEYTEGLQGTISTVLTFLQVASALVAVLMIAIVGFEYITGTPDVKEEMKKKLIPIIVGLVLVFGATSFAKFILAVVG